MKKFVVISLSLLVWLCMFANEPIRVACVGNSITYGLTLKDREKDAYPFQLQRMLGDAYTVGNFGRSGATLLRKGHRPYNEQEEYQQALDFNPDIVVIHLGVNDTDPRDWPDYSDDFVTDYLQLIEDFKQVNPNAKFVIARLTPISASHRRFQSGTRDWRLQIQDAIENVAAISGAQLIDFDAPLRDHQNYFLDGVHPNENGSEILATTVYKALTGDFGGLQMPIYYSSGMVLQRDRPITISGTANAGSKITVSIAGKKYNAVANKDGQWSVEIAPLKTGKPYTLTVSDGTKTLTYDDILAGEVWLASGQSNMEFKLNQAIGSAEDIKNANDPQLRLYNMQGIVPTYNQEWTEEEMLAVDRNEYLKPATWQPATPETVAPFSAIAYYFGKQLRDSLNVPVGIICNAVGGSTTESWIDINTLEEVLPEILVDWKNNDFVQEWARGRAEKNAPGKQHRHPYEPSYLFASGIRPLEDAELAGVIWYQGESNAHNIEAHELLFTTLVDNWRQHFDNDSLPFHFVQLSGINRPSWPKFRDSQRKLAESLDNVSMAISYDYGDSLDVHPRNKKPIGERLARQALHYDYGFDLTPSGPTPISATAKGSAIILTMDNANGLTTADGKAPSTFEIAEVEGLYYPAKAEIKGNIITLKSDKVKKPKYVRYAWQPFTRANLVNSDGLPTSTFKLSVD